MPFQILGFFLAIVNMHLAPILPYGIFRDIDSGYGGGGGCIACQANSNIFSILAHNIAPVKSLLSKEFW